MNRDQLLKMAQSVNCEYEPGIRSEIDSFIEYQNEKISDFILNFNKSDKCFCLKILMTDYEDEKIQTIFQKLVEFIEYKSATFYIREENDYSIEYFLLSSSKAQKGVLLHIEFMSSKEKFYELKTSA
jgi:hypothetical protein